MSETGLLPPVFADRLVTRMRTLGHPLCVGLDPHLDRIPALFRGSNGRSEEEIVGDFLCAVIDRVAGRVAVVKPQIAFFEALGWRGLRALERVVAHARAADLLVLLDAKRGDIGSTATGYARAYLDAEAPLGVDAITLSPYLGRDTLEPWVRSATATGRGLFVLVKTSNPGSGDYQGQAIGDRRLYEVVASSLAEPAATMVGPETGWSSLGVVVGATYPGEAENVRACLPRSLFLVPGYGAQGGSAADAVRGFLPGPAGLEGGIVSSSRGVLFPPGSDTDDLGTWQRTIDAALDRATGELGAAVQGS